MEPEEQALVNLQGNISEVLSRIERDAQSNRFTSNEIVFNLIKKLRALNEISSRRKQFICYVIGNTDSGKSTSINGICGKEVCKVSDGNEHGTRDFQRIDVPQANAIFIDTVGFGSEDDTVLAKELKERSEDGLEYPDVILLVVTRKDIRNEVTLKQVTEALNSILKWSKKERFEIEVPVVCVLSKVDEYFRGRRLQESETQKVEEYLADALKKVNEHLCIEVKQRVAVSYLDNYHIDHLLTILNIDSPLNAQMIQNNQNYCLQYRKSMAEKIIASFAMATAAVSLIPVVDLVIIPWLEDWMVELLHCFKVDPSRTVDGFRNSNWLENLARGILRGTILIVGDALELTALAFALGAAMSGAAASAATLKLGWACYSYFTA